MRHLSRFAFFGGIIAIVAVFGALHAAQNDYAFTGTSRFPWLVAFALIVCILTYGLDVPDVGRPEVAFRRAIGACLGAVAVISAAQLVLGTALLPRSVLAVSVPAIPPLAWFTALLAGRGQRQRADRDRVLAVVEPEEADRLRADLGATGDHDVALAATHTIDEIGDLEAAVASSEATILVLGRRATGDTGFIDQAAALHAGGLRVRTVVAFYEEWLEKLPVPELRQSALLFDVSDVHRTIYRRASRGLDLVIAVAATPLLLISMPVVVIGNLVANRGPLFFRQPRVGRNGELFDIVKLRTMDPGSESAEWTAEGDARITPFGRVLRRSHLDELPQVLNILRGELSVVGPRPEQPHYVEQLESTIPFYQFRHVAQPGLTGWAQINYRYGNTEFDAVEKLQFEFYYLRHQSLWLDLRIIARTLQSVVGRKGK